MSAKTVMGAEDNALQCPIPMSCVGNKGQGSIHEDGPEGQRKTEGRKSGQQAQYHRARSEQCYKEMNLVPKDMGKNSFSQTEMD